VNSIPDFAEPAMPPPGLPDVATLARLAGEFFAALPGGPSASGGVPLPTNPHPPGLTLPPGSFGPASPAAQALPSSPAHAPGANLAPTSPQTVANAATSIPASRPHAQAPNGVPDNVLAAAPGYDRLGSHALAVPQAYPVAAPPLAKPEWGAPATPAPAVPQAYAVAAPPAATPEWGAPAAPTYYFLGDRSTAPAASGPFYFVDPGLPGTAAVPQVASSGHPPFDVNAVRRDFPILQERVNGRPLVWFDNAATTQKPRCVIDRLVHFYEHENSNIHRAAHELAARATDAYEEARETVRRFIGAGSAEEIVFVRGTTEAINLVAKTWGAKHIAAGDEIIVSHLEHHANIVPWLQLAAEKGAILRVIPVDDSGQVLLEEYQRLLGDRTKIVAVSQVSNALGTVVPVREIVALAHRAGARALVDGAQSVSHMRVDVQALDADFFVFSGHKIFGPTGIGVVYGKREVLEAMPPWQGGGNMITDVTFERALFQQPPGRFEAGTGNIADAVGLGAALEYVERIGIEAIGRYEHALLDYATHAMRPIPGVRLIGTARDKASVLSFVLDGYSPEEVGKALNEEGIAVRAGHHCAQPILRRYGLEATVRPSFAFYNTCEEIDRMVAVVRQLASRSGRRA
jgi:cysteine desulfurase/selenocysteine lyase